MEVKNSSEWIPLKPKGITHPNRYNLMQFEKAYREDLNILYRKIKIMLFNKNALEIWQNINYTIFVNYIFNNSFKTKLNKI